MSDASVGIGSCCARIRSCLLCLALSSGRLAFDSTDGVWFVVSAKCMRAVSDDDYMMACLMLGL